MGLFNFIKSIFTKKNSRDTYIEVILDTPKNTETTKIGDYVKEFESGNTGAACVSWDSTGGTSYGTYQLAAKTKVFKDFLKFISTSILNIFFILLTTLFQKDTFFI